MSSEQDESQDEASKLVSFDPVSSKYNTINPEFKNAIDDGRTRSCSLPSKPIKRPPNNRFMSDNALLSKKTEPTYEKIAYKAKVAARLHLRRLKAQQKWAILKNSLMDESFLDKLRRSASEASGETADHPSMQEGGEGHWGYYLREMIFGKWLNLLFLFMPLASISYYWHWSAQYIFWFNFLAMLPLASILSDFTEELALHTNETLGGLISATFGNAVELVVGFQALLLNEFRVVQASMLGSVFSNLLLVLGSCFFFGGMKYKEQSFNATSTTANMSLLSLSTIAFVLPTPFSEWYDYEDESALSISRLSALCLVSMYFQLLIFQFKTHADLVEDEGDSKACIPFWVALGGLFFSTALVTFFSELLVESIDEFVAESGISKTFVGMIILPIIGNAVEHITAITVATKDKMDLAMAVAIGSCTQISLFVVPALVIAGWFVGKPMNLNYPPFEVILLVLSITIVAICVRNNSSNWLVGSLLITTYIMVAIGFFYEKLEEV